MKYTLPPLPYAYNALDPAIPESILKLHHDRHHQAYVDGANKALAELADLRQKNQLDKVGAVERVLAFNLSGHTMHALYWQNLTPKGGGTPTGALADQITRDFGGFDAFKAELSAASATIPGSGWGAVSWDAIGQRLIIEQIHDHQNQTCRGATPIMVLDAWEHAFYLAYGPDKKKYIENIWSIWNWDDISRRLDAVRKIDLGLKGVVEAPVPAK
jgi:superoxide dismutase, Fe-Mn family